jgi:peptidoglycan hydrolase-like protein with peptidoglycan-binding domain
MTLSSTRFRLFLVAFAIGAAADLCALSQAQTQTPPKGSQGQPSPGPDASIQKVQEALVWTGYYDGPIDGSAGTGTQSAIKKFQRDIGKPESGALDDAQSTILTQRGLSAVQATGYRSILDSRSGLRIGIPFLLAGQKRDAGAGTDYVSNDGRIQISLRTFRTNQEISSVFNQLKERFSDVSQVAYSPSRSNWFIIAGESATKKYYVRYYASRDLISGFFAVSDKSLPKETNGLLVSTITFMSLAMQAFAADINSNSIATLNNANLFEPVALLDDVSSTKGHQTTPLNTTTTQPIQPGAVAGSQASDDVALRNLQKKLAEMEATQRRLEQELEARRAEKTDPSGKKPPAAKDKTSTPDKSLNYETLGLLAAALFVLILLIGRRSLPSKAAEVVNPTEAPKTEAPKTEAPKTEAPKTEAPKTAETANVAGRPASSSPKVAADAPLAGQEIILEQVRQRASGSTNSGLGVVVSLGGMIAVVLLVAFLVEKVSSISGF